MKNYFTVFFAFIVSITSHAQTDGKVAAVYTLGQLPIPSGIPYIIQARITNNGATTLTNLPVTLTVSGANTFSNSQSVTLLSQQSTLVSFDAFTPVVLGSNSVSISIPADDTLTNNIAYYLQTVTSDTYSYADGSPPTNNLGWGNGDGLLLTKYNITGTATVSGVNVHLNAAANTGNTVYAVVLNAAGAIIAQSDPYITAAADLDKYKNFVITSPPSLSNTDFYVGLAQTANATTGYYPLSTQTEEAPSRPGAYYFAGLGGGLPAEFSGSARFMIQAVLNTGTPPNPDPYSNSFWTWMKGDSAAGHPVYGSLGIGNNANKPGDRYGAVSWTDSSGKMWLFGGNWSEVGELNDLWIYDPAINQWTWMKGDSVVNSAGAYGTQGISSSTNKPGARVEAVSWTDRFGNLWLFGGIGYADSTTVLLNDLWKYNVLTNQWTWVKGDNHGDSTGVYGTQGIASVTNKPGARSEAVSWIDSSGNLWLFGGSGYGHSALGQLNDLWTYNPVTNEWAWIKGDSAINIIGAYGTPGIPAPANKPGARRQAVSWTDTSGNLWLFGGRNENFGRFNDLWRYNPGSNQWTYIKGDTVINISGVYGTQGIAAAGNKPGAREASTSWIDASGNLWLFGGSNDLFESVYNDLWKYDPTGNQWTWVKGRQAGDFEIGVYGTQGVEAPANTPGSRDGSVSWIDRFGYLWLFGGSSFNDLWKIYGGQTFIFTGDGDWPTPSNWINNMVGPRTIPGGVSVIIDHFPPGKCDAVGDVNLLQAGQLTIRPGKKLNIIDGNMSNAGLLNGLGKVVFSGIPTALSSPGSITAPLTLLNKQLFLTGNTNTKSIELLNGSNIKLNTWNLNMDTGSLVANSTNYIIADSTGRLTRFVATAPVAFPVGISNTSYTPATITNAGLPGNIKVSVMQGVQTSVVPTTGNVDRTWLVGDSTQLDANLTLTLQWNAADEQPGFDRTNARISHFSVCPPPANCDIGFFDFSPPGPASGTTTFSIERSGIQNFNTDRFVVTSSSFAYRFTGNGNWNIPANWTPGQVPLTVIGPGMDVIIDGSGECVHDGSIIVQQGGTLTVEPGKQLRVTGNITVE